jgi:pimeloyl-ACP methyl ester carboxylesterase
MNDSPFSAVNEEAGQRMIKTNGVDLCTQAFGDPTAPALLLIMGATASMVRWPESLCRQLADSGLYVIRYDNRDTGISTSYPPYAPPYTAVDLADDAVGILDAYSIQQAHTWGISLGGMIIQQLAINHPDRLLTATIMSSTPDPKAIGAAATGGGVTHTSLPGPTSVVIELIKILANVDWHDPAAAVEAWVTEDRMLYGTYPFDEAASRELAIQQVRRASNILSHRFNHPIAVDQTPGWRHRLPEVQVPALIIHGTEDAAFPEAHAYALAHEIAGARLVMIEQLGHVTAPASFPTIVLVVLSHVWA